MAKRFDVVATLKFTKKDGTEGKSYVRCGAAFDGEKGISLKLDSIPVAPGWDGWLSLYEPKPKDGEQQAPAAPTPAQDDGPIPF